MVAMANSNNFYLRLQRNVYTFYYLIKAIITFIQLVIPGRERERSHNPGDFEWSEHTDPPIRPGGPGPDGDPHWADIWLCRPPPVRVAWLVSNSVVVVIERVTQGEPGDNAITSLTSH